MWASTTLVLLTILLAVSLADLSKTITDHSCFEAVYGDVNRAKGKSSGSLGLCGVCRRDMKIGDGGEGPGKGNSEFKLFRIADSCEKGEQREMNLI